MPKVWVKKEAILAATKSTRIKAWANTFKYWIPGSLQREARHQETYKVDFTPTRGYGRIRLEIPAEAINIDVEEARQVFKAGPDVETYDQVWDIIKGAACYRLTGQQR